MPTGPRRFYQVLTDQPGKDAWPISGATFILMYKTQDKPANAANVLKFFDWAYANGDKMADELDYVPLPASVKDLVRKSWAANIKDASGKMIAWQLASEDPFVSAAFPATPLHRRGGQGTGGHERTVRPPHGARRLGRTRSFRHSRTARPG